MLYMNVKCEDLLAQNVVSEAELTWVQNVRIPYNATADEWLDKHLIDRAIKKALASGIVCEVEREEVKTARGPQIISDYINSSAGDAIKSQADGKMYDSKSQYYKSVKDAGCVVLGTDAPTTAKEVDYKINEKELKQDIANAIQQLGG